MNDTLYSLSPPRLLLQVSGTDPDRKEPELKTPSDYFAIKYPKLTQAFGPAFLESHWLDKDGFLNVDPVEINIDLFAGIVGGSDQHCGTIYYLPEHQWYQFDPVLQYFAATTVGKLKFSLSQEILHCALYFSQRRTTIPIGRLFQEFRTEEMLESILKRAEGLLGVTASFFDEATGNRKDPLSLTGEQTTLMFAKEVLEPKRGTILTVGDAYGRYVDFCQQRDLNVVLLRKDFRAPVVMAVRDTFGIGIRKDLKVQGKYTSGWSHLDAKLLAA